MKNYDLIQLLTRCPMDMEVTISTKAILEDDSDGTYSPESVKDGFIEEGDEGVKFIVLQS